MGSNGNGALAMIVAGGSVNVYHAATTKGDPFASAIGSFLIGGVLLTVTAINDGLGTALAALFLVVSFTLNGPTAIKAANNIVGNRRNAITGK